MLSLGLGIVDVRDVALAHLNAVKNERIKGVRRFLLVNEYKYIFDIGAIAHQKYGKYYPICMDEIIKDEY